MSSIFSIIILVVFIITSYARNSVWKNEYTLWADVVYKSPNKAMPHINLGNAFLRRNVVNYAENEFNLALQVNPKDTRAINGLAVIYMKTGSYNDAIKMFDILSTDKPHEPGFHSNIGVAYMQKGLLNEAIAKFNQAIKIDPDFPDAYANLGLAFKKKGMLKEAKQELEKALRISPEHRDARKNLDDVLTQLQDSSSGSHK